MKLESFDLKHHLPYLLRRAHFLADATFVEVYGSGITSRQLALLTVVAQQPGTSQTLAAQEIGLDLNTCSDLVGRLVAKGFLRRERSPSDARSFCLYVSDAGWPVVKQGLDLAKSYQQRVAAELDTREQQQLVDLLHKLLSFG